MNRNLALAPETYQMVSAASTNAVVVNRLRNQRLVGFYIYNSNAAARWVRLYSLDNTAPVAGAPVMLSIGVPPQREAVMTLSEGILFPNGMQMRITAGAANNDNTAVGANDVTVNLLIVPT